MNLFLYFVIISVVYYIIINIISFYMIKYKVIVSYYIMLAVTGYKCTVVKFYPPYLIQKNIMAHCIIVCDLI